MMQQFLYLAVNHVIHADGLVIHADVIPLKEQ